MPRPSQPSGNRVGLGAPSYPSHALVVAMRNQQLFIEGHMPGTAVSQRKASWQRIKHKYRKKDAAKLARRERDKVARQRLMQGRRALSKAKA
jgi:hypothetical protein